MKNLKYSLLLILVSSSLFCAAFETGSLFNKRGKTAPKEKVEKWFKTKPVKFLENKGQLLDMDKKPVPYVWFKATAPGIDFYITEKGLTYVFLKVDEEKGENNDEQVVKNKMTENVHLQWEKVDMVLKGANLNKNKITKEGEGITEYNYFFPHCQQGISKVKDFTKITIADVYPGIDWVFYNSAKTGFKYDFVVHPGADPSHIQMAYQSRSPIELDLQNNLHIHTGLGNISENAPYSYYAETKAEVGSAFKISKPIKKGEKYETIVSFAIDSKNNNSKTEAAGTLVIDPQLIWSTFYGGTSFEGTYTLDSDLLGNIYMCGYNASPDLPLVDVGNYFMSVPKNSFILKFNSLGALLWATYCGSTSGVNLNSMATDNTGNIFISGNVSGTGLPLLNAGTFYQGVAGGSNDAFILKFTTNAVLLWGTFYGGTGTEWVNSIACDNSGNLFVSGYTSSNNFPVQNAGTYFQGTYVGPSDGFILKFDNAGNRIWATLYEKMMCDGITCDNAGNVIITGNAQAGMSVQNPGGTAYFQPAIAGVGTDIGILKFDNAGNRLWATYYGGTSSDQAKTVVADRNGNIFISGVTTSTNLPVQNAGTFFQATIAATNTADAFILKFNAGGTRQWATYYGGTRAELITTGDNMAVDTCDSVYMTFETLSSNPALQAACEGGYQDNSRDTSGNTTYRDIIVVRFSNAGALQWGSFLGGNGNDFRAPIEGDKFGNLYVTGEWIPVMNTTSSSSTYPVVNPGGPAYMDSTMNGSDDVFVTRFKVMLGALTFSYTSPVCSSSTLSLLPVFSTGSSSLTGFSAAPGLSLDPVTGQITPSASIPGTYTVTSSGGLCTCASQTPKTVVTIGTAPPIALTGTNTICIGTTATITASGATSYTWSTGAKTNSITLKTNSNVVLTVIAAGAGSCITTTTVLIKVNSCTGLEESAGSVERVLVYANPNKGDFTIESDRDTELELTNILGQHVRNVSLNAANNYKVNVTDMPQGTYFLKDRSGSKQRDLKVIVE